MKPLSFLAWAVLPALGLVVAPGIARADDILVYAKFDTLPPSESGNEGATEAKGILEGLGHNVTVVASLTPVLPADLSAFDTIWVIQLPPIATGDDTKLRNFVRAGGGLYLTGDNSGCCNGVNDSIDLLFAPLLVPPAPMFASQQNTDALLYPSAANPFGLTTTPNAIAKWETVAASSIGSVPPARKVFEDASARVGAAAFVGEDMEQAAGCVYVAMDLSFWLDVAAPTQNLTPLVENIEHFLEGCADSDHDGLSDAGEPGFGTDPADPDSDDDGLCDGFGNVPGVCVPGETVTTDFDGDGVINPLDADDDGDGIPTKFELAAEDTAPNADSDNIPAQYDSDSDGDFILDGEEGSGDYDDDGIPAIVDYDDEPSECELEADCGAGSGLYCNLTVGRCHPGCFAGGNGCPSGETCTSTDETIGQCSGGGTGGAGGTSGAGGGAPGGSGGSGASSNGGTGAGSGGGAGTSGGGGAKADSSGDDGGCGCGTVGADERSGPIGAALLVALTMLLRRRRTTADR